MSFFSDVTGGLFGGGDTEQTTQQQVQIPDWLLPYAKPAYIQSAQIGSKIAAQPYQAYGGQDVARMSPGQKNALSGLYRSPNASAYNTRNPIYNSGSSLFNTNKSIYNPNNQTYTRDKNFKLAERYTNKVLSGDYMKGNPYLQGMINRTKRGVTDSFMKSAKPEMQANMARQGAFGGSGWVQQNQDMYGELADQLGDVESDMRFQNYATERGYRDKAVSDALTQDMSDLDFMRARIGAQQAGIGAHQAGLGVEEAKIRAQQAKEDSLQNALSAGELSRGINQKQLDVNRADWEEKRDWLFRALQGLQGGLGNTEAMYGRTGTSEGSGGGNLLGSLGQLAGGAGMFMQGWNS